MVDLGEDSNGGFRRWVCPNDRQLALRAKLAAGWCMKAHDMTHYNSKISSLNEYELSVIKDVIQQAEEMEIMEQHRIGRLVDAVNRLRGNAVGDGGSSCLLCGEKFRWFGARPIMCRDCSKKMCDKCGLSVAASCNSGGWLCKICYESKEMWKKSGGWFTKSLPIHRLPSPHQVSTPRSTPGSHLKPIKSFAGSSKQLRPLRGTAEL